MSSRPPFFTSARGRLLMFNLLVVAVTLMVSGVAVLGFRHASQIQEQVQQQTLDDMTGSMNLARDTANVATAAMPATKRRALRFMLMFMLFPFFQQPLSTLKLSFEIVVSLLLQR